MTMASEARRPGITKLYQRLKRQHPNWSEQELSQEAKSLYTCRTITHVDGSGRVQERPNPDYMAARDR